MTIARISLCLFLISFKLHAHTNGHGARLEGLGPNGGHLSSVVLAKDADLGEKAKTQAIAEWTLKKKKIVKFQIWDETRKIALKVKGPAEIKWIVIAANTPSKAEVFKMAVNDLESDLSFAFTPELIANASSIEVILPNVGQIAEKCVFTMPLK